MGHHCHLQCSSVCVCEWVRMCTWSCVFPTSSLDLGALTEPGACQFSWTGCPANPRCPPACLSRAGMTGALCNTGLVSWGWGLKPRPSCLTGKHWEPQRGLGLGHGMGVEGAFPGRLPLFILEYTINTVHSINSALPLPPNWSPTAFC